MADSLNGLNLQASYVITHGTELLQKLTAEINKAEIDEDGNIQIDHQLLKSLEIRISGDMVVIQKLWDRLEETITK